MRSPELTRAYEPRSLPGTGQYRKILAKLLGLFSSAIFKFVFLIFLFFLCRNFLSSFHCDAVTTPVNPYSLALNRTLFSLPASLDLLKVRGEVSRRVGSRGLKAQTVQEQSCHLRQLPIFPRRE